VKRYRIIETIALVAACAAAAVAPASEYPVRPIRMVVPFVAGGSSDIVARIMGQALSEKWGQQIVVDDRPGGGTVIGTEIAAQAPADGYTLVTANVALSINEALGRKLPYRALHDFQPLVLIARQPTGIVAFPAFPAQMVNDLVELAKLKPGEIAYGSAGVGTIGHLAGELLQQMTSIHLTHVPYKGGGQLVNEVLGNQVPLGIMGLPPAIGHIRVGKLKVLAVTDGRRAAAFPDVPTVGESLPGFEVNNWIGILGRAGTPADLVEKIYADCSDALHVERTRNALTEQGFEIWDGSPADFARVIAEDIKRYGAVVKEAKIAIN
jgi:tripartite-type tricarboxylate transporter receptor subunit TctC